LTYQEGVRRYVKYIESEQRQKNAKSKKQMVQQDRSGENTVQALESELQRQERQLRKELHEV
jgi:hypothetical protein